MELETFKARVASATVAASVVIASLGTVPAPGYKDKNCDDFRSQKQAQKWFKKHGGSKKKNVAGLDADGDGIACENTEY